MSVCRKLPDGTVQKIAGHTILLDANAAEIREGTGHLTKRPNAQFMDADVTFSDPMPDTDYAVDISFVTAAGISALARVQQKTVTGFKLEGYVCNESDASVYGDNGWDFKYIAWKPIKLDGYTALQNKVNSPDDTPTIDSMNLVTSDGVARAIENASAVWKGTKAEWNALPAAEKQTYDLAVLLDKTLVKAVDREDGTETDVANLNKIFRGTKAEWEALSATEKAKYDQAEVIDEYTGVPVVVDKVESGNLNPVTSNAVAEAIAAVNMDSAISIDATKWSPKKQVHAFKVGQLGIITWGGNTLIDISTDANDTTNVAQLSIGFRPNIDTQGALITRSGAVAYININAAGKINLCCPSGTLKPGEWAWAWGQVVFVIGN